MSSFSVSAIIEKSENRDKDLRHMALYDLHTELQKENVKLDDTSQKQLAEVVLKLLDDKHSEVQGMAVKCMGPLVTKMSKLQVENSVSKLTQNLVKGDDDKRDIATIALKTVISKPPISIAIGPVKKALPVLVNALGENENEPEIKLDALDVLNDILKRFGNLVSSSHSILQNAFMNELGNSRPAVRKRATTALALLSQHTSNQLFDQLTDSILFNIRSVLEKGDPKMKTYIQLTSQVARNSGHRLGKKMDEFVDLLLKAAENIENWEETEEGDNDEIREYIMQAFESFVLKCPSEVTVYVELILYLCGEYIEYDPDFSYEESEDEGEKEDEDEGEGEDDEDDKSEDDEDFSGFESDGGGSDLDAEEYSEDDDVTWKVRKAACRCVLALIKTKPDLLGMLYKYLCHEDSHVLLSRFKERDESVKLEVFKVFEALLGQTYTLMTTSKGEVIITQHKEVEYLKDGTKMIVSRIMKQIGHRSPRVKNAVFSSFKELAFVMQGGLEEYIKEFVKQSKVVLEMEEQHTTLKLVTLEFLQILLEKHDPAVFSGGVLDTLIECVYKRVDDKFYRITAEAIKVCSAMVPAVKKSGDKGKIKELYKVVFKKLKIQDIDQDVKENAIKTMGVILSTLGMQLPAELKQCLPLLLKRLKNETTRLVTCKAVGEIAASEVDLSDVTAQIIAELSSFLRKNQRALRQAALSSLTILVSQGKYSKFINDDVVMELAKLVSDEDLHLSHLSLTLAIEILKVNKKMVSSVEKNVLPRILALLGSSTLQGATVDSSMEVIKCLVPKIGYNNMLNTILSSIKPGSGEIPKQVYINIAHSVSGLIEVGSPRDQKDTISKFQRDLKSSKVEEKMLSLFTIGEIGRKIDLSGQKGVIDQIQANFDSSFEEIKNAASYSLGNVSIGNLEHFLPMILAQIKEESKKKYLLIHSLKEIIIRAERSRLLPYTKKVTPLLFEHAHSEEEGVRNVVSECLGKFSLQFYEELMPQLKEYVSQSDSQNTEKSRGLATIISAVKYVITEKPLPIDELLTNDLLLFLNKLNYAKDKDLTEEVDLRIEQINVRRNAILLLNSVAHNKPSLIVTQLSKFIPHLYAESKYDKKYVRVIDLGPFKHKIDDTLELRKSAYECLDTLLSTLRDHLVGLDFVEHSVVNGINDPNEDIKMLAHIMAIKCCAFFPSELLKGITKCCMPISKFLKKRMRDNVLQQVKERHEELIKSTLKVIYAISKLKESSDVLQFTEIITKVIPSKENLKRYYLQLKAEDEEEYSI